MIAHGSATPHGPERLAGSRARHGVPRPPVKGHRRLVGNARVFGVHASWSLAVDDRGAFDWRMEGEIGERMACDGSDAVARDWTGASRVLEMCDLESRRAVVWALTGAPGDAPPRGDGRLRIELDRAPDGTPTALRYETQGGVETWRFEWASTTGSSTPRRVVKEIGDLASIAIDVRGPWRGTDERLRLPQWTEPTDFRFASAADRHLDARKGPYGHLLVRASLNGGEEDWYILDSGASSCAVTPDTARRMDLARVGTGVVASVMGTAPAAIYRADSASLGPLTLRGPRFLELDFAPFGDAFGVPVGGVLGFDVFRRARVRISFDEPTISIRPAIHTSRRPDGALNPGNPRPNDRGGTGPGPRWLPVSFNMQHPIIPGGIGGRPAHLRIDIGMGGDVAAIVHPGALERLGVEGALEAEPVPLGAGTARAGTVPVIELAGRRWEPAAIVLPDAAAGVFHDPWVDATIGHGLLRAFDMTFDYPNGRIGLAPAGGAGAAH